MTGMSESTLWKQKIGLGRASFYEVESNTIHIQYLLVNMLNLITQTLAIAPKPKSRA